MSEATNVCEYCGKSGDASVFSRPVKDYDAGNGTTAFFHVDCHADLMAQEPCDDGEEVAE